MMSPSHFAHKRGNFFGLNEKKIMPVSWNDTSFTIIMNFQHVTINFSSLHLTLEELFRSQIFMIPQAKNEFLLQTSDKVIIYSTSEAAILNYFERAFNFTYLPQSKSDNLWQFGQQLTPSKSDVNVHLFTIVNRDGDSVDSQFNYTRKIALNSTWQFDNYFEWDDDYYYIFYLDNEMIVFRESPSENPQTIADLFTATRFLPPISHNSFLPSIGLLIYGAGRTIKTVDFGFIVVQMLNAKQNCVEYHANETVVYDFGYYFTTKNITCCTKESILMITNKAWREIEVSLRVNRLIAFEIGYPFYRKEFLSIQDEGTSTQGLKCFDINFNHQPNCLSKVNSSRELETLESVILEGITVDYVTGQLIVPHQVGGVIALRRFAFYKCEHLIHCLTCETVGESLGCIWINGVCEKRAQFSVTPTQCLHIELAEQSSLTSKLRVKIKPSLQPVYDVMFKLNDKMVAQYEFDEVNQSYMIDYPDDTIDTIAVIVKRTTGGSVTTSKLVTTHEHGHSMLGKTLLIIPFVFMIALICCQLMIRYHLGKSPLNNRSKMSPKKLSSPKGKVIVPLSSSSSNNESIHIELDELQSCDSSMHNPFTALLTLTKQRALSLMKSPFRSRTASKAEPKSSFSIEKGTKFLLKSRETDSKLKSPKSSETMSKTKSKESWDKTKTRSKDIDKRSASELTVKLSDFSDSNSNSQENSNNISPTNQAVKKNDDTINSSINRPKEKESNKDVRLTKFKSLESQNSDDDIVRLTKFKSSKSQKSNGERSDVLSDIRSSQSNHDLTSLKVSKKKFLKTFRKLDKHE